MQLKKTIAIICDYKIFPERMGGMDYFFVAYDRAAKEKGNELSWFFRSVTSSDFYKDLNIIAAKDENLESLFLNYCSVNKLTFDVVITHFLQPVSTFYKDIKKQQNSYIISVDHNPRPLNDFPIKKRIKNKIKGILFGKYVDQLVGVSNYTKKHILKDFGENLERKTNVVYNGIKYKIFTKQQFDRTKTPIKFIVVSHLRESKGIQDLFTALNQLDKRILNNLSIDIYGDGPFKTELQKMHREFNLIKYVNFKGNSSKINEQLHNYHYLIQPTYMECFSLSILESLASNVPVITTTVGGNPEIIKNGINGFLFEPTDTKKLASIINNIVVGQISIEESVYHEIEKNYTLEKMVQNHLNLLP